MVMNIYNETVSKEEILKFLRDEAVKPIMDIDLAAHFEIKKSEIGPFFAILDELESEGMLIRTKKNKFGIPERFNMMGGRIQTTQKSFAFFLPDDKEAKDIFVPPSNINGAMNGDKVLVKVTQKSKESKKAECVVIKIVKRANEEIVGTFEKGKSFGFVVADDRGIKQDIFIPFKFTSGAKDKDKVVVKITKWPEDRRNPEGKVIEVLGSSDDPETDILAIIRKFKLPEDFPKKARAAANDVPMEIDPSELVGRKDLRDQQIVTIDGADARDLDDAVTVRKLENGNYFLGVHIADVTHYVKESAVLDKEALKRATSVYLVDRVIPMLPRRLSNGICSLNPNVDRLTLGIEMEIDPKGKVVRQEIVEGVIKTVERMTYTDVSDILEGKTEDKEYLTKYDYLNKMFFEMEELCKILRKRREFRGTIDFNFPESKVILDEDKKPIDVKLSERRIANRVIEEFMLVANETIAEHMFWLEVPFVYRVHENPNAEKIEAFNKFIHNFGFSIKGNLQEVHPKEIQGLLKKIEGTSEEHIISKLMLRSLKQARYSPENEGHFGLAAQYYCHFTSPIRRYPDLQIHRIIKEMLHGDMNADRVNDLTTIVHEASNVSSERERIAEKAERESVDLKKAEYMLDYVGEEFDGTISSVTGFGMFVELPNTIEGLVRIADLGDDYYTYDEANFMLVGEATKKKYKIGDKVRVIVDKVDVAYHEIDFLVVEE